MYDLRDVSMSVLIVVVGIGVFVSVLYRSGRPLPEEPVGEDLTAYGTNVYSDTLDGDLSIVSSHTVVFGGDDGETVLTIYAKSNTLYMAVPTNVTLDKSASVFLDYITSQWFNVVLERRQE